MSDKCRKNNCLHCDHYAIWDGDYCCVHKMLILSYGDPATLEALNPNEIINERDCVDFKEINNEKKYTYNKDMWNYINQNNIVE